jgi:opacity protein-like surface antigen
MKWMRRSVLLGILGIWASVTISYAQTTVDPDTGRPIPRDRVADEQVPSARGVIPPEQVVVRERIVERDRPGELYVAGFGGFTLGHSFSNTEGRGTLAGQEVGSFDLANSVVYGMKLGYFHPGRLNWLGLEMEGFNTTPHLEQQGNFPGSYLRVATLAFNVIARKRLGCRAHDRDPYDRTRHTTTYDKERRDYYEERTPLDENARCPIQVYAGAGPAIFFAETSNQFGRSTDNAEVGVNALAGLRYFVHRNVAIFGEYKFNYAGFDFSQLQGTTAGVQGNYKASHFVGGLAVHF